MVLHVNNSCYYYITTNLLFGYNNELPTAAKPCYFH